MNTLNKCTFEGPYYIDMMFHNTNDYIRYSFLSAEGAVKAYEVLLYDAEHPRFFRLYATVIRWLGGKVHPPLTNATISLVSSYGGSLASYSNKQSNPIMGLF